MTNAVSQLRQAIAKALIADTTLTEIVGTNKVFDTVPERVAPPYVVVGRTTTSDWSTATEGGEAITLFIHTWSRASNSEENDRMQEAIKQSLSAIQPALDGHHLVNLRFEYAETRRDRVSAYLHGVARFRGVTEPLQ
ncbi:MAG: DUF3168 domain-containing protein [Pseudomonadota bacterium]